MTEDQYEQTARTSRGDPAEMLQRMARAGWELVKTDPPHYHFRRLLTDEPADEPDPPQEDPYRYHTLRLGGNIGSDDIQRMLKAGWEQTHSVGHTFHFRRLNAADTPPPLPVPISTSVAPVNAKLQVQGKLPTPGLICPHCGISGRVTSRQTKQKAGISGGKATAALLTGGVSLLVPGIGLSRKVKATLRHCDNCGSDWTVR